MIKLSAKKQMKAASRHTDDIHHVPAKGLLSWLSPNPHINTDLRHILLSLDVFTRTLVVYRYTYLYSYVYFSCSTFFILVLIVTALRLTFDIRSVLRPQRRAYDTRNPYKHNRQYEHVQFFLFFLSKAKREYLTLLRFVSLFRSVRVYVDIR